MNKAEKTLHLNIVDSHGEIFHGQISSVTLSGTVGNFSVLPEHAPLISSLKPGEIHYYDINGNYESLFVSGGIVEVQPMLVTVLADTIIRSDKLDAKAAQESIDRANNKIQSVPKNSDVYEALLKEIQIMKALVEMARLTSRLKIRR